MRLGLECQCFNAPWPDQQRDQLNTALNAPAMLESGGWHGADHDCVS